MSQFIHTTSRGSSLQWVVVCALLVLVWPASAQATLGRCMEVSDLAEQGVESFILDSSRPVNDAAVGTFTVHGDPLSEDRQDSPCDAFDDDDDPSSNLCFEDADGQISTLPRLLAQWHAQKAATAVIDSVFAALAMPQAFAQAPASIPARPQPPAGNDSCSSRPDECRSLPPLAPTVRLDVPTFSAHPVLTETAVPIALDPTKTPAWAMLRIGPRHGHHAPPDKPPQG